MNVSKRQVRGDHVQHAAHQPRDNFRSQVRFNPTRMSAKRSATHTPRQCWPEKPTPVWHTRVRHEDEHGHAVKTAPHGILPDFELNHEEIMVPQEHTRRRSKRTSG